MSALKTAPSLSARRAGGTHVGPFRGIAPTRRHVNVAEFAMYRVTHRRIVEFSGTSDNVELLAQLTGAPSIEGRR